MPVPDVLPCLSSPLAAACHQSIPTFAFGFWNELPTRTHIRTSATRPQVRRSGRPSLVVLALACVMGCGCLSVGVFGLKAAVEDLRAGKIGFTSICAVR